MKMFFSKKKETENSNKAEKCILCHADTGYTYDTPIEKRDGYVEGVGQLCWKCWIEFYDGDNRRLKETTAIDYLGKK